jgi:uncharacterized membrane protein
LGEADHTTLAAASHLSLPTIDRALNCLEAVGLVVQKKVGRRVVASPNTTSTK